MTIFISVFVELYLCELDVLLVLSNELVTNFLCSQEKNIAMLQKLCASNISIITKLNNI